MGSVLKYIDENGASKSVLVLDAKYRSVSKFGVQQSISFTGYDHYNKNNNIYIFGRSTSRKTLTDKKLIDIWSNCLDDNSSKYNCDFWMQYKNNVDGEKVTGCPAVEHCRSKLVPNYGYCDLPNINILLRIFIEANYIDRLDPTLDVYGKCALGDKNPNGFGVFPNASVNSSQCFWWSSTAYIDTTKYATLCLGTNKIMTYGGRSKWDMAVIPILELDEFS